MCNELQEQLQRQQQQVLQEQQQVQRREQAGPEQPEQLEEQRTEQQEQQMAVRIQGAFPPAGAQEPPEEPAAPLQQEQAASESKIARSRRKKREKKAERLRQEEERRRQEEEERLRQEEEQRRQEEKRLQRQRDRELAEQEELEEVRQRRGLLMNDDEFLAALNTFANDQTEANAELVLRTASRRLVALVPDVADRFEATADLRSAFPTYRMAPRRWRMTIQQPDFCRNLTSTRRLWRAFRRNAFLCPCHRRSFPFCWKQSTRRALFSKRLPNAFRINTAAGWIMCAIE